MSKKKISFYETDVKNRIFSLFIVIIVMGLVFALIFVIIGAEGLRNDAEYQILLYVSPMILLASYVYLFLIPGPRQYNKIKKLLDSENEVELTRLAKKINVRGSMALCALYDLSPGKVKPILDEYHVKGKNPKTDMGFIKKLTKLMLEEEVIEKSKSVKLPESQTIIPITKAYFIKNRSALKKGMISKVQLTLDYEVVICPYCSNMAKKDLLSEWLKEKNSCPVCFTNLAIDDCPIVDIRDN